MVRAGAGAHLAEIWNLNNDCVYTWGNPSQHTRELHWCKNHTNKNDSTLALILNILAKIGMRKVKNIFTFTACSISSIIFFSWFLTYFAVLPPMPLLTNSIKLYSEI